MKIKSKLTFLFLSLSLIPLFVSVLLSIFHSKKQTEELSIAAAESTVAVLAQNLDSYFKVRKQEINLLSNSPIVSKMDFIQMRDYLIAERDRSNGVYEKFIIGKPNGHFFNTSGGNKLQGLLRTFNDKSANSKPKSIHKRDYWQNTINHSEKFPSYVSNPMISYTTGVRQIVVASTIVDSNQNVVGMIGGALPWKQVEELILSTKKAIPKQFKSQVKFMLVSNNGTYLYHWDADKVIQLKKDSSGNFIKNAIGEKVSVTLKISEEESPQIKEVAKKMLDGQAGYSIYKSPETQEDEYLIYQPLPSSGYSIAVTLPYSTVTAPVESLTQKLLFILIISTFVIIIIGLITSSRLSSPIILLSKVAKKIGEGKEVNLANIKASSEIVELSDSIQTMNLKIQSRKEDLEKLVNKRTKQLKVQKNKAEEASESKSDFLANMSHEIRTPMNGVLGMLDLVLDSQLNDNQKRKVQIAQSSAQSLLTIINDILDYSKIEANKLEIQNLEFNTFQIISEFSASSGLQAENKKLELIFDTSGVQNVKLLGDPSRYKQVLTNIVANAIKFTQQGTITVTLKTQRSMMNRNQIVLSTKVVDTGIGIPQDKIAELFNSFSQADSSATREYGGTGLGLSISQKLCSLMDGEIDISSQLGKGTSIEFSISLNNTPLKLPLLKFPALNKSNILIYEPSQAVAQKLERTLKSWGAKITTTSKISEIYKHYDSLNSFDWIIIDKANLLNQDSEFLSELKDSSKVITIQTILQQDPSSKVSHTLTKPLTTFDIVTTFNLASNNLTTPPKRSLPKVSKDFTDIRILIVEDNQINQLVIEGIIKKLGFQITIANNGQEALDTLQKYKENHFSFVLMDCQMPILDGYQTTRAIRAGKAGEIHKQLPIIALTANAMLGDDLKCKNAGMNDYLTKPIDPEILSKTIHHWINKPQ